MSDQDTRYRLVLLGASRTGKSSIIQMFLNGKFLETYKETVEDLHYREFTVDDKTVKVDILDTAGKGEQRRSCEWNSDRTISILFR